MCAIAKEKEDEQSDNLVTREDQTEVSSALLVERKIYNQWIGVNKKERK